MKARILLIDEAQLERKIIEWTLAHDGYQVVTASNGDEALRLAQAGTPDVIVMDALLPDLQLGPVVAELKRNSITARIPVIVLARTGLNPERLKREGAAEILDKENALTDSRFLLNTVEGVLHPVL